MKALLLALTSLTLVSCASMSDVMRSKPDGTVATYAVSPEQAWKIASTIFRSEGSEAIEEHREAGYMLTSSGASISGYGTLMGAWIEKIADNRSKVTVVTKRKSSLGIFTTLTENTFHKKFKESVDAAKNIRSIAGTSP